VKSTIFLLILWAAAAGAQTTPTSTPNGSLSGGTVSCWETAGSTWKCPTPQTTPTIQGASKPTSARCVYYWKDKDGKEQKSCAKPRKAAPKPAAKCKCDGSGDTASCNCTPLKFLQSDLLGTFTPEPITYAEEVYLPLNLYDCTRETDAWVCRKIHSHDTAHSTAEGGKPAGVDRP